MIDIAKSDNKILIMISKLRHRKLLQFLEERKEATIESLAAELGISSATVRRDLKSWTILVWSAAFKVGRSPSPASLRRRHSPSARPNIPEKKKLIAHMPPIL